MISQCRQSPFLFVHREEQKDLPSFAVLEPVEKRVFHQGLQQQVGDFTGESLRFGVDFQDDLIAVARLDDIGVIADVFDLLLHRNERLVAVQGAAEQLHQRIHALDRQILFVLDDQVLDAPQSIV